MSYEQSVSYFKRLENLEKIRRTNGLGPAKLPVDNKKRVSATTSVDKSSKNPKESNMWCYYCDKNNHNKDDYREIAKLKQQRKTHIEAKAGPKKKAMAFLLEEIECTQNTVEAWKNCKHPKVHQARLNLSSSSLLKLI
jgi:hypothetical protein